VIIINDNEIIKYEQLKKFEWSTRTLGNIEDIKNIKVIINDKLKNSITLNDENIEMFKKTNFVRYDK
jgi:hypothetical protein